MTKKPDREYEKLVHTFASVFHSFEDMRKVSPIKFLEKLKQEGVTLAAVSVAKGETNG